MSQGLRYRAQRLLKNHAFNLVVVLALTSGIGAHNTWSLSQDVRARVAQSKPKARESPRLESPRIAALEREVKAVNRAALRQFWKEVKGNVPLVESVPGNDQLRLVTFLWRGGPEARDIKLDGIVPHYVHHKPLINLAGTDVWFLTARFPVATRCSYGFAGFGDKKSINDPLGSRLVEGDSIVELPGAPPQPWILVQPEVPKGVLKHQKIRSEILKEERAVSVYTPAGYNSQETYWVVVLFDGEEYRSIVPTPIILETLVAAKKIHPLVALLVDSGKTRDRDLQCSAPFAEFLAKELLPWARQRYRISSDPRQTIVGGSSYGGLGAAYCAFRYPEVFGNVLSQSASFGYYPGWDRDSDRTDSSSYGWLIRQFVTTTKLPIRFYVEAGLFETHSPRGLLAENRRMRDVLEAKGYSIVYSEYAGGHEYLNCRGSLADGLIALAGQ